VRTVDSAELLPLVAAAFAAEDPSVRVVSATSVGSTLDVPLARPRLSLAVLGAFGVVVLLLAGVGVYGVMAASVRSRFGEMGVRMACGATPTSVGTLILRQGMAFAALGIFAGVAAALASGRLLEGLLFGVSPADGPSLAAACVLVLAVAAAACVPPALRAARTDPVRVLREE
jgi:ABC-type antimicrobial peptide transport system permease subunit